tara:strand:+ start:187 stop:420 length:234 start_codon:yes stop_codon:yes gene_type:complete
MLKDKWTIKEEKEGTTWWMIRGGAFSNVINSRYPHRIFEDKEEAERYCNNINRGMNRNGVVVNVKYRNLLKRTPNEE